MEIFTKAPVAGVTDYAPGASSRYYVVLRVGEKIGAFGDGVTVRTPAGVAIDNAYIAAIDIAPANEFDPEVTALFGAKDPDAFHQLLEKAHGTGLPKDVLVTLYTLYPTPVEETAPAEG